MIDKAKEDGAISEVALSNFLNEPFSGVYLPVELSTSGYSLLNRTFWDETHRLATEAGVSVFHTDLNGLIKKPDGQEARVQGLGVFFGGPGATEFLTGFSQRASEFVASMKR